MTTPKPPAPKEFWIEAWKHVHANPGDHVSFTVYEAPMPNKNTIHVVEKSALDHANKRIEELEAELKEASESLKWIMPKVHQASHEDEFEKCMKATCVEYRKATQRIARVLEVRDE